MAEEKQIQVYVRDKLTSFLVILNDEEDFDEAMSYIKKILEEAKLRNRKQTLDFKLYL